MRSIKKAGGTAGNAQQGIYIFPIIGKDIHKLSIYVGLFTIWGTFLFTVSNDSSLYLNKLHHFLGTHWANGQIIFFKELVMHNKQS